MSLNINWDEVIKKEARGIEDYDLGDPKGLHISISHKLLIIQFIFA